MIGLLGSELVSGIIPILVSATGNYLPACSGHAHLPVLGQLPAKETSQFTSSQDGGSKAGTGASHHA